MNILGFNPNHHGSVCLLQDGEIIHFIQEERIIKEKYAPFPFKSFIDILQKYTIDYITWASPSMLFEVYKGCEISYWEEIARRFSPKIKCLDISNNHHLCHVTHSFYNSGFKKSLGIVIDGMGTCYWDGDKNKHNRETESIYVCSYPYKFDLLYKNIINTRKKINLCRAYETVTMHLGWHRNEVGKTMGLAPYGNFNPNFPNFFKNNIANPNVFYEDVEKKDPNFPHKLETFINEEINPQLKLKTHPKNWHYNESQITNLEKDLAWRIQNGTQKLVEQYIEEAIKKTNLKQICCSGGYFLNCVANYYLTKRFPNIEFYFEPIANDAGTAIGAAKYLWHKITQDTTIRPFKSLYLGKKYTKEELLEEIKKYVDN
jgi:carbamoyltransferase